MNRFFNIVVGAAGLLYVLNDTYFRLMVNLYMHQGYSQAKAEKIANSSDIFVVIIILAAVIAIFGTLALISNLILFSQHLFFLKILLNAITMLMPFVYVKNVWFLLYEVFFIFLFTVYLIDLRKMDKKKQLAKENVSAATVKNKVSSYNK